HRRQTIYTLVLVSVLMAVSTALIGPMTFFGFLVATLAYQLAGTHDHRRVLPVGVLIGFVVLAGAYFVMNHVFYAQGVVSIIIELVGGSVFLVVILRKGRLSSPSTRYARSTPRPWSSARSPSTSPPAGSPRWWVPTARGSRRC